MPRLRNVTLHRRFLIIKSTVISSKYHGGSHKIAADNDLISYIRYYGLVVIGSQYLIYIVPAKDNVLRFCGFGLFLRYN